MEVKLNELVTNIISGEWGEDPANDNGINVIRSTNFTNIGKLDLSNIVLRDIAQDKVEKKRLLVGDTIIEKSGGSPTQPVGRVVYFNESEIYLTNNFTSILRPDTSKTFPKYFFYRLFELHKKGGTLKYQNKTTGIINLKLNEYLEEYISLPSYADQIRIANLLGKIEQLIDERKKNIDLLDELVKATFYKMFGDPATNEKDWTEGASSEYAENISVGVVIKPASYYENEGVIALRSLNIQPQKIDLKEVVYFSEENNNTVLSKSKLRSGDVVLVRTGNTGTAAIIPEYLDGINCIDLIICRPDFSVITSSYLVYFFNSDRFKKVVENHEVGGVHKHLNIGTLKQLKIPIPPIELQNQFTSIAQKIEKVKEEQEAHLKDLEELYASVSQKAFKGELDLSRVAFDETLLPTTLAVVKEVSDDIKKIEPVKQDEIPVTIKRDLLDTKTGNLTWEQISFERVANYIRSNFDGHYFNSKMLLRYLEEDLGIGIRYYSSAEKKKYPALEEADDLHSFIAGAVNGRHDFLQLEQVFYNAEEENIPGISFTEEDLGDLQALAKKDRSGIYFRIKSEVTQG